MNAYIQRFAFTKDVKKGGNITQNHSGLNIKNKMIPTKESNAYNQYVLTDSDEADIIFPFKAMRSMRSVCKCTIF